MSLLATLMPWVTGAGEAGTTMSTSTVPAGMQKCGGYLKGVPARFEAIGEALVSGASLSSVCAVVGRDLARDSVDLGEALSGLRTTFQVITGADPSFDVVEMLTVAWSEETLGYIHQVSCEDPMTGISSLAYLRSRLLEVQRGAVDRGTNAAATHALVVIDLPFELGLRGPSAADGAAVNHSLELARAADRARLVFAGDETLSQASCSRLIVLSERHPNLAIHAVTARELIDQIFPGTHAWIEGIPASESGAAALISELARVYEPL